MPARRGGLGPRHRARSKCTAGVARRRAIRSPSPAAPRPGTAYACRRQGRGVHQDRLHRAPCAVLARSTELHLKTKNFRKTKETFPLIQSGALEKRGRRNREGEGQPGCRRRGAGETKVLPPTLLNHPPGERKEVHLLPSRQSRLRTSGARGAHGEKEKRLNETREGGPPKTGQTTITPRSIIAQTVYNGFS